MYPMPIFTDSLLDTMRNTADPLADATVATLFRDGQIGTVNSLLDQLSGNTQSLDPDMPEVLRQYLDISGQLPVDVDWARIRRAQEYFTRFGPFFGVALMYCSLPALYAGSQGGVQILAMTGQLKNHYRRRAAETLRFILDVTKPKGLEPQGKGIRAAQKVRLMHATIRHFARVSGRWEAKASWGAPINQEELAGTLMSFSIVAADNVKRMGIETTEEEVSDYVYLWHCIGHILGVVPELRPLDIEAARSLWQCVDKRNFAPTPEGIGLAQDHLAFLNEMVPGRALDGVNSALMRFLMGDNIAVTCLGLPPASFWEKIISFVRKLVGLADHFAPANGAFDRFVEEINLLLMDALQKYWARGNSKPFRLPTQLDPIVEKSI
jgi:hypothetical protein